MKYTLQKLCNEDIKCILELYSDNILCKPIVEKSKQYNKYIKGFRPNKLHRYIIEKIYFDEIHKDNEGDLGNYLIHLLKNSFKGTRIEEVVQNTEDCDVLEIVLELQKEIFAANLSILPTHILMLADIELDAGLKRIIIEYNQFFNEEKTKVKKESEKHISAIYEEKDKKLRDQYEKCYAELEKEKNKSKDLEKLLKQKDSTIDSINKENILLINKLKQFNEETENYKSRLCDYNEQIKINSKLLEINEGLKKQIDNLEKECVKLKESFLSPEIVQSMCYDVMEDLKLKGIDEKDLLNKANNIFLENDTLSISWEKLSVDEIEKLGEIMHKMENNYVQNDDIDLLDEIEINIQLKYMLIKGLKVVFYKYLEKEIAKGTIDQIFNMS